MSKKESPHKDENKTADLSKQVLKYLSLGTKISDFRPGSERFESAQGREQQKVEKIPVYLLY
jgi:hypothetical protein